MKTCFIYAALLALSGAATAADGDLQRCRMLADAAARLACYDAIPLAPAAAPAAPAAAAPSGPPADFGIEHRAMLAAPEQIESRILGLFEGWGPKTRLTLENGQVWQVVDDSRAIIDKRDPVVRISRGALGSFIFEVVGRKQTARVKRLE